MFKRDFVEAISDLKFKKDVLSTTNKGFKVIANLSIDYFETKREYKISLLLLSLNQNNSINT